MHGSRRMRRTLTALVIITAGALAGANAAEQTLISADQPPGTVHTSLGEEAHAAVSRGLDWLAAHQKEDGSWSNGDFPALTALPLWAFTQSRHPKKDEIIRRAVSYILTCAHDDGSIYREVEGRKGGGLSNYNTAICMTALHAVGDPALAPVILKAREFIAESQHFGDDIYRGGFGYDRSTRRAYTDLLNTFYAVQAMKLTQDVEDRRPEGEPHADIDWSETVKFIERMQNKPAAGSENAGGFYYNPTDPKAGTTTNKEGVVVFRAYGSITYAGMLALVYADIDRSDVRVQSAFDWAAKHWTLKENPGMGDQGLYFFYNVLSRCLDAYGRDLVPIENGEPVNWREALIAKIVALQKIEPDNGQGYWVNDVSRYWEGDPVLVTAYTLLALESAL